MVNSHGKGRAIHIPWLPGQLFYRQGHPNTSNFVADLLENVVRTMPVGGNLSPMVEVTLFQQPSGDLLVHLVNTSGHFGTTYYAPVTMCGLSVRVPCAAKPLSVTSLVSGQELAFEWKDRTIDIKVDKLDLFEALRIDL